MAIRAHSNTDEILILIGKRMAEMVKVQKETNDLLKAMQSPSATKSKSKSSDSDKVEIRD